MKGDLIPFRTGGLIAEPYIHVPENVWLAEVGEESRVTWILGSGTSTDFYNPYEVPDLFLRFANIGLEAPQILRFAKQYGMPYWRSPEIESSPLPDYPVCGTKLSDFRAAVSDLRVLLKAVELVTSTQWGELGSIRRDIALAVCKFYPLFAREEYGMLFVETQDTYRKCLEDPEYGARQLISTQLNYYLRQINFLVEIDTSGYPVVWPRTRTLLEAVYSQLVLNLQEGRSFGTCPTCGKTFSRRRSDKVYCSKSCGAQIRMRRYRAHRKANKGSE